MAVPSLIAMQLGHNPLNQLAAAQAGQPGGAPSLAGAIGTIGTIADIGQSNAGIKLTLNLRNDVAFITVAGGNVSIATQVNGAVLPRGAAPGSMWPFRGATQAMGAARPIQAAEEAALKALLSSFVGVVDQLPAFAPSKALFVRFLGALR